MGKPSVAAPAVAAPGLPRGYQVQRVDSPNPTAGGDFGIGFVNTGDVSEGSTWLATVIGETEISAATIYRSMHSPANQPEQKTNQDRP